METNLDRPTSANREPRSAVARRCIGCGYSLRGLPESGRCPECGSPYLSIDRGAYADRPVFGWFLLVIPPVLLPIGWTTGQWVPDILGGFLVLCGTAALCLVLSVLIAWRLARWRYGPALQGNQGSDSFPSRSVYIVLATMILAMLELAACFVSLFLLGVASPWLERMGYSPPEWG